FASFRSRLFFNDPATTELYSLSLHDALPICDELRADGREVAVDRVAEIGDLLTVVELDFAGVRALQQIGEERGEFLPLGGRARLDRKSTRLNSSHGSISYAVFCLKKKKHIHR